jgi:hypothetical protein
MEHLLATLPSHASEDPKAFDKAFKKVAKPKPAKTGWRKD